MSFLLSMLTDSGNVMAMGYPFAAEIMAMAMPVFPEVASRIVFSLVSLPADSAYSMRYSAILSLTEPPMLYHSSLASTSAESGPGNFRSLSMGVSPMSSVISLAISI